MHSGAALFPDEALRCGVTLSAAPMHPTHFAPESVVHRLRHFEQSFGSRSHVAVGLHCPQSLGMGNRRWERAHGGERKEMWQADDGAAVPPELGMPGANATVPNSRRDLQVLTDIAAAVLKS